MMQSSGRLQRASHLQRFPLQAGWQLCATQPDQALDPAALHQLGQEQTLDLLNASLPSTVASALLHAPRWHPDNSPRDFDVEDWWYRLSFQRPVHLDNDRIKLCFGGLATLADVWLNGKHLLHSDNMFRSHDCDVTELLQPDNELLIRFASVQQQLKIKRPRPRWKAPMIPQQQLRWIRTTLLGRTPGWSPSAAAVGPWRGIWLEQQRDVQVTINRLHTRLEDHKGIAQIACQISTGECITVLACHLQMQRNERTYSTQLQSTNDQDFNGELCIDHADAWWPHTHGEPALYPTLLLIRIADAQGERSIDIELGSTGFRKLSLDTHDGNFALSVNGLPVFCRGACWTPPDVISLNSASELLRQTLQQVRAAGMNMLRISGTMIYESDEFLQLCDEYGILLWQDFMFANMDYPETPEFIASISSEIEQQLSRMAAHPCLAVLCGNSEGEQQAAMFGATRDRWHPALFHQLIPELIKQHCINTPYWPSSAHGGAIPYQNDVGTTSYYGVGAYLRPLEDARRSEVRFATECLAFANVPDDNCIEKMPGGLALKTHHPQWKARTPRDLGAGWDFEDVRDHYLQLLFGIEPARLRYENHDRYWELSRIVSGEVMAATLREWRSEKSRCNGALIWFLRDLWAGAGWGIVDATGTPKAAYYYLQRALQPIAVSLSDEGCNGVYVHLINESAQAFTGTLQLAWYQQAHLLVNKVSIDISLGERERRNFPCNSLLEYFSDLNHAYRFGPAPCDLIVASLRSADDLLTSEDFFWPQGRPALQHASIGLRGQLTAGSDGAAILSISTEKFAQAVTVQVDGFTCAEQYFHLVPGEQRDLSLLPAASAADRPPVQLRGCLKAINSTQPVRLTGG